MRLKPKTKKQKADSGFVILFAVTISSLVLAIALGVANIALKEVKFGTNARDTNNAFFAADTATEYILFNDKSPSSLCTPAPGGSLTCNYVISSLGGLGASCARIAVTKDNTAPPTTRTTVISKGYNLGGNVAGACNPPANSVERELLLSY